MDTILFFFHHALNLLWGVILSASFIGVRFTKRNAFIVSLLVVLCAIAQLSVLFFSGGAEERVWQLYPLVIHFPLTVLFCFIFKKKPITSIAAVAVAYLCCQPSKWFGLLVEAFTDNIIVFWVVKIVVAIVTFVVMIRYFSSYMSNLLNKDTRSVMIFGSLPFMYYLFDYVVGIYTNLWVSHYRLAAEFLSFSLCVFFVLFCVVYYKEYEKKIEAEHKEQIISIAAEQQAKEIENMKKSSFETALLRHDMRLMLSNLALCIEENDNAQALKTISGFLKQVESASVHRYCKNDTVNYILSNFDNKCKSKETDFIYTIEIDELPVDEILFSSIVSNALDNALNAQSEIELTERRIKLMLKCSDGKLLFSVKNPFKNMPVFVDGVPQSSISGHGYGTQSIRYLTEKLGGKCQFTTQNNIFILRVVL